MQKKRRNDTEIAKLSEKPEIREGEWLYKNRKLKVLGGSAKSKKKRQTKGKGLYMNRKPKVLGGTVKKKGGSVNEVMKILNKKKPLNSLEMQKFTEKLKILNFIGVFMRDTLPKMPSVNESAVVNLDVTTGPGTHWVCYYKKGSEVHYYYSFGFIFPKELEKYLKGCKIWYNYKYDQKFSEVNCGHRCLEFLLKKNFNKDG